MIGTGMNNPLTLATAITDQEWERMWGVYDEPTYQSVLGCLREEDVVLEIGAGDLRLARRMAGIVKKVYALEINEETLAVGMQESLPPNLEVIRGDAQVLDFPRGITVAVLMMRHCRHFRQYAEKVRAAGGERLITNARWRMDVEEVALRMPRLEFENIAPGWYACWCGNSGFKPGAVEEITPEIDDMIYEVFNCPVCDKKSN